MTIEAPLDVALIVFKLGSKATEDGRLPTLTVTDTKLIPSASEMKISVFGDLPLFQTHEFEKAVEKWVYSTIEQRAIDFGNRFQKVEDALLNQFDYTKDLHYSAGDDLHEYLAETIEIRGGYLELGFKETFSDSNQFVKPLRQIEDPSFSEDFTYDLQVLMDENTLNEYFAKIYEGHVPMLSVTQTLKSFLPKSGLLQKAADIGLKALMSVKVWSAWFPDLSTQFKPTKVLDLQCGMSKQSLSGVL